ncbi:MAG: hypothetical protein M9936_30775 [Caldilinea sp.]|nr:hypothetical protein [Caldilineaceae bacterium]MCB9115992.1 hypothetical protein [Caldilineaceae bacterium]MCB9120765.1 hypothetical protein [Caldilineaceae bacterium]MCO5214107.1 hypothetical protein [Caldilinea sp.]MCW5844751.1 hypothetical protein [Caldilinea sp.]
MVPQIQLMLRVERDAAQQRNPAGEDRGESAIDGLIRTFMQAKRAVHLFNRAATGRHTFKQHEQGARQCKCAY